MPQKDMSEPSFSTLSSLGFRICVSSVSQPIEYAKFLIQIGHEPLPSFPTRTLLGRPAVGLPNVFKYVQYIKNMDGWVGCYHGFAPRVAGQILGAVAATHAVKVFRDRPVNFNPAEDELSDEEKVQHLKTSIAKDFIGRTVNVLISHPFLVISHRIMAQFVGGEDTYNGFVNSILHIYREEGFRGFFAGLVPRWIGEITTLVISSLVVFGVNSYLIQDRELRSFTAPTIQFFVSAFTYPMNVVSSCMSVNNCGLLAGMPPNMPVYKSWVSCYRHLSKNNQLNRGSSLIFRYYFGPPGGVVMPAAY